LGSILGGMGGSGASGSSGSGSGSNGLSDQIGSTLGNLLQQGLGQRRGQNRTLSAPASPTPDAPPASAQNDPAPEVSQDSQPMNDVLKQLFNR
jgi:AsmA protein